MKRTMGWVENKTMYYKNKHQRKSKKYAMWEKHISPMHREK